MSSYIHAYIHEDTCMIQTLMLVCIPTFIQTYTYIQIFIHVCLHIYIYVNMEMYMLTLVPVWL